MIKKVFLFILIILCFVFLGSVFLKSNKKNDEFVFWTIQLKGVADELIEDNIKIFKEKHPEINVVWIDIPIAETQKRILASTLSSTPPDLVNLNPDFSSVLAQKGALEFIEEKDIKDYNEGLQNILRYHGKAFAIPFYVTSPVTVYNKEILNRCSKKIPRTYDELYEISKDLCTCSGKYSLSINLNENDTFSKILNKYDVNNSNTILNNAEKPYTLFKNFYKNSYISKESLTINHREAVEKYMAEESVFTVVGANFIKIIKENAVGTYKKSDVTYQLIGNNGKYDVALMNLIIPKKAKHKELALEFAHQLTNKENQLKLAKLTNVLPVNKCALEDNYFKNTNSSDLLDKSRVISANQIKNLVQKDFGYNNKKSINDIINKTLENILILNSDINIEIDKLAKNIKILERE